MVSWPESLVREIAERRVVLFIGSGISKSACPALPTWSALLIKLSDKLGRKREKELVKQLIRQGKLLDAAQVVRDSVPKADINAELRNIFQVRPIPFNNIYSDMLLLDPKTIITTNYDEFIEKNFEHFSSGSETHSISDHKSDKLLNDMRSPIRSIVKMHGSVDDPSSAVLDRSSYFEARQKNPSMFSIISSAMTVNTVLFLGYSISDPDIQITLENINLSSPSDHRHCALVPKFDHPSLRSALTRTYNVDFVEYPAGDHGNVALAVQELRESVISLRQRRGIV